MEDIMEKFKNFLYDKSDIIIAIAILLVAALVIAWRLNAIVEYPKEIIDDNNSTEFVEDTPSDTPEDVPMDVPSDTPENNSETDTEESTSSEQEEESKDEDLEAPQNTTSVSVFDSNGYLTQDVTVTWSGSYAIEIIQCAVNQGLFEDYNEYANICLNNGIASPENIPYTKTSTFPKGSTKVDIALQIHK